MQEKTGKLTQAEYARRAGISQPHVSRLCKRGLIQLDADGRIDPLQADRSRAANIVPRMRRTPNDSRTSFLQARAEREKYSAKLAKLEFERQSHRLVDADVILQQLVAAFANVRLRLRSLPKSLAPVLADRKAGEIEQILSDAIDSALVALSNNVLAPGASGETGDSPASSTA